MGYDVSLLSEITFCIRGGQKVVLTGFNGIDKSTLLKMVLGQLPALGGTSRFSSQVKPGYFEQDLRWDCPEQTPFQIVSRAFPRMDAKAVHTHLTQCRILRKHAMQPVKTLSGSEHANAGSQPYQYWMNFIQKQETISDLLPSGVIEFLSETISSESGNVSLTWASLY